MKKALACMMAVVALVMIRERMCVSDVFTVQGRDTVDAPACPSGYTVLSYVDSVGCTGCKLRLSEWSR